MIEDILVVIVFVVLIVLVGTMIHFLFKLDEDR
jgi:hypothetical protein